MDKPLTGGEMLEKVGYSPNLVKQPGRVMEAQGVKDALAEYGLTEELIVSSLASDIKGKPKDRVAELRLAAQLRGMTEDKQNSKTVVVLVSGQTNSRYENPDGYGVISGPGTNSK